MTYITKKVDNENPNEHWEFIHCNNKVAVDLGCGRWEKVEKRDASWPTTPEFLIQRGASIVYAFDIDADEIEWYQKNISTKMKVKAAQANLNNIEIIRKIYQQFQPKIIKCDIEGYESLLLELTDEEFKSVDLYAVETHSNDLYNKFIDRFTKTGYNIVAVIDLIHAPLMKAIFAQKEDN
jgi:hypothetical protein